MIDPRAVGERLEAAASLDAVADPVHDAVTTVLPRGPFKDTLHGVWLGHPLHPSLTDLPIGFWTSAFVLDLVGGRRCRTAADALVALGVASAVPTAVTGLADWSELNAPERRTGLIHAAANVAATVLYALSSVARLRGRRASGVALGLAGATAATVGGFLGGHLAFRRGAGVNHAADAPSPTEWTALQVDGSLTDAAPTRGSIDDVSLVLADDHGEPVALFARCSHLGGPLDEGELAAGCVRCPWHGSTFRMVDGSVVRGPATAGQPAYDVRSDDGKLVARRR